MGGLEGLVAGAAAFTLTVLLAPYAAPAVYAATTGLGVALGYSYNRGKSSHASAH